MAEAAMKSEKAEATQTPLMAFAYSSHRTIEMVQSVTAILANVAVVLGLVFAAIQLIQFRAQERVRVAIEATSVVYSPQFLTAYANATSASERGPTISTDDLYYVANVYDSIAILQLRGVADDEIIRRRVGPSLQVILKILDQEEWSPEVAQNIRDMSRRLGMIEESTHKKPNER